MYFATDWFLVGSAICACVCTVRLVSMHAWYAWLMPRYAFLRMPAGPPWLSRHMPHALQVAFHVPGAPDTASQSVRSADVHW